MFAENRITYGKATDSDVDEIDALCTTLIRTYENAEDLDLARVLRWCRRKIENSIEEYTTVYLDGSKAGYYHFYKNQEGEYEIDDLYILPAYRGKGIGTAVIDRCCAAVDAPVMLYVFVRNERAVSLYQRLGFSVVRTVGTSRYVMQRQRRSTGTEGDCATHHSRKTEPGA